MGMVALVLLMKVDYRNYNDPKVVFTAVAVTMLLLIGVFAMRDSHNTHRWFRFGIMSFQPSELAKPTLVLFLAYFLQTRIHKMDDWQRNGSSRGASSAGLCCADPDGAGSGNRDGVCGGYGTDAVSRRDAGEVSRDGAACLDAGALLPAVPRAVAQGAHAGVYQS